MWMNRYPGKAIFSGSHDPSFGGEFLELICATIVSIVAGSLLAIALVTQLGWTGDANYEGLSWLILWYVCYLLVLAAWAFISSIIRKRPRWGVELFVSGAILPGLHILIVAVVGP